MGVDRSLDYQEIGGGIESTGSGGRRCAPAADPRECTVLARRERGVEYDADHLGGRWVILTNAPDSNGTPATNFKLVTAPDGSTSRADWTDLVPHRDDVFIEDFDLFDGFTAVAERSGGLERIRLLKADGSEEHVKADEDAYSMGLDTNSEHD